MNSTPIQPVDSAPKKSNKKWIIVVIILLVLCCLCLLIGGVAGYFFLQEGNAGIGFQQPDLQLPNLLGVQLGDEVRYENCGYSFKKVPDYKFTESGNIGTSCWPMMTAPGGEGKVEGPYIVMIGNA